MEHPDGKVLPRRGSLHWSNAYDVMNAETGSIMVTPTPDFDKQLTWMIEEDIHDDLIDPKYLEPENLRLRVEKTMDQLRDWVATKNAEDLFFEAQERHMPYGLVFANRTVAENPQLIARDWSSPIKLASTKRYQPALPTTFLTHPGN